MAKLTVFFIIIFLVVLSLLAYFNQGTVSLTVWEGTTYEIPLIALVLISTAVGIFAMFIIFGIRDVRRCINNWQIQRQEKKESKIKGLYSKGLNAFFAGRYEEATELFTRVIEVNSLHINVLLRMGDISYNKGDLKKARDFFTKAEKIAPRNIEVLLSLEKIFKREEKWQEALKYLDNILEIDDENPNALYSKRDIYETNKKWEELLDVQYKILRSDIPPEEKQKEHKNLLGYKYELGCRYLEEGDSDNAIKILKSIIKMGKDFAAAYLTLAEAYLKDENVEEAKKLLMKGYDATSSLLFLVKLEDLFLAEGEPSAIIDFYLRAVGRNQKDPELQFFMAKLYYRLEMIDHAFDTINAIDTHVFDSPDLHILLGNIHERRTEYAQAVEEFKKASKVERRLLIPFCCSECGYTSKDWEGRCPECRNWNSFDFDIHGICKA